MEQGTISTPNLQSFDRLTGTAVFFPDSAPADGVHLGDISMHALTFNPQREHVLTVAGRSTVIGYDDTISISPAWSIEGMQFHSAIMELLLQATRNADATQAATTGQPNTITLNAKPGRTYDLGARQVANVIAGVGSTILSNGTDFFLEAGKGLIRFPEMGGIGAGATVLVRFDTLALTRRNYTAFDVPDVSGRLALFEMESQRSIPKNEWSIPGIITPDSIGDGDPGKHRKWKLRFSVTGQAQVWRRDEQAIAAPTIDLSNVLVDENGDPIIDENGNFITLS